MFSLKSAAGMLAAVALVAGFSATAAAQPRRINAVVMLDDSDPDSMRRKVRIYRQVLAQLQEVLNTRGVQVYEEPIVSMSFQRPNNAPRSDVEAVAIARAMSAQVPIDVAVVFQIIASAQQDPVVPAIVRPRIRMPGRIVNVRSGQFVGAFEVNPSLLRPLPNPCDQECLLETVGSDARELAGDLGTAIAQKLEGFTSGGVNASTASGPVPLPPAGPSKDAPPAQTLAAPAPPRCDSLSGEYWIKLHDFANDEILEMERNLRNFGCFEEMRPTRSGATYAEYAYRTSAGSDRLNRNLRIMLDYLGLRGQVRFDGANFDVVKVQTRQQP
jgi:hypothetical protein